MAKYNLSKGAIKEINKSIELVFDKLKTRFLGPNPDNRIMVTYNHPLSLPGLFESAASEEGTKPHIDTLNNLVEAASSYLDASQEQAKARTVTAIRQFLSDASVNGIDTDWRTVLGGQLADIWKDVSNNVERIIHTETAGAKNISVMDGIIKVNESMGIGDPVVYFVVVHDGDLCAECKRLHLLEDLITPRCWKLSELSHSYHVKGEDKPSVTGEHPHCFVGSTKLFTSDGIRTIKDLYNEGLPVKVSVDNRVTNRRVGNNQFGKIIPGVTWLNRHQKGSRLLQATHVYETGIQKCYKVTLDTGHSLEVSEGHDFWIDDNKNGYKKRADQLIVGDKIPLLSGEGGFGLDHFPDAAELMGNLMGDGTINGNFATWHFFGNDIDYGKILKDKAHKFSPRMDLPLQINEPNEKYNVQQASFSSQLLGRKFVEEFGFSKRPRRVPNRIWTSSKETISSFLRGLYAADGCSDSSPSVALSQNDREFLCEIQLLLNNLGFVSRIYSQDKAQIKSITYANGDTFNTNRKATWRLLIGGMDQVTKFANEIGFGVPKKQKVLLDRLLLKNSKTKLGSWRTAKVSSIKEIGMQQTYCLTEPLTNTVCANGVVVGNCRCTLVTLMSGYGFDKAGMVVYVSSKHNEIKKQRSKLGKSEASDKKILRDWTGDDPDPKLREKVPVMTGEYRSHALSELKKIAKMKDGSFVLYRGMSYKEEQQNLDYDQRTSWTPYKKHAQGFAKEYDGIVIAALIPAESITTIPFEFKADSYSLEHEVIVEPGQYEEA